VDAAAAADAAIMLGESLISFWLECFCVEELASLASLGAGAPNQDLVFAKALDHEARGFWPAASPSPKLSPQLFRSPLPPAAGCSPLPDPELLFDGSLVQEKLWTLKLVRVLVGVRGEFKLACVAPDTRCELASFVDVGDGGACW